MCASLRCACGKVNVLGGGGYQVFKWQGERIYIAPDLHGNMSCVCARLRLLWCSNSIAQHQLIVYGDAEGVCVRGGGVTKFARDVHA